MCVPVVQRAADLLAELNPDMTIRSVQLFCLVAGNPGQSVTSYAEAAGLPMSTASRLLKDLSTEVSRSAKRIKGAGILVRRPSTLNGREVVYFVTPKGARIIEKVTEVARYQRRVAR